MTNLNKALLDIENIRSQLAKGTVFQGFGPAIIAATGCLAAIVMMLQIMLPNYFATNDISLVTTWIVTAVISVILVGTEMIARSRRHHGGMADAMLANAVELFLPSAFAGAVITAVILKYSTENIWILPGIWQICLALGLFAAARSLPRSIYIIGAWYFLTGTCVLIFASLNGAFTPIMMGLPFFAGQLLMGFLLHIASEEQNNEQE